MEHSQRALITHCMLHTAISAVPSFAIALSSGFDSLPEVLGMLMGIAGYALLAIWAHLRFDARLRAGVPLLSSSIGWVKRARLLHAVAEILVLTFDASASRIERGAVEMWQELLQLVLLPDFYAGLLAMGGFSLLQKLSSTQVPEAAAAVILTLFEGLILSLCLLLLALLLWLCRCVCRTVMGREAR